MRVLILHSRYLSGPASGENRVAEEEAALLRQGGHEVHTWAPAPEVEGRAGLLRTGASAIWSRSAAGEVTRLVRRNGIQVVHAHNLFPTLSPAVLRAGAEAGAAVVLTLHNYRLLCLPANLYRDGQVCEACVGHLPWRGVAYRCYRDSLAGSAVLGASIGVHRGLNSFDRVTKFFAVSRFIKEKHAAAGISAQRIHVKPNFTWPAEPRTGPGDYFLYLGRLAPEKGVDTLLAGWQEVPGRLLVVGDGPDGDRLRRMAPSNVEFRGVVEPKEVPGILAGARALLAPSRWYETSGRSVLEAYASGVPVIASRIGALPEAVEEGRSGWLVPPGDHRAWARAASRLTDDAASEQLGEGALQVWRDRYSPERGLREMEAGYAEALGAAG